MRFMDYRARWLFSHGREAEAFDQAIELVEFGEMTMDCDGGLLHWLIGQVSLGLGGSAVDDFVHTTTLSSDELLCCEKRLPVIPLRDEAFQKVIKAEYAMIDDVISRMADGEDIRIGPRRIA